MKNLTVDLSEGVKSIGRSIGKIMVVAESEQQAHSVAETWCQNEEEKGQKGLGITDCYFSENDIYYFAIVN